MNKFMRAATRKKREYMMEVALKLFIEHGYEKVSVDDIIKATNTSKGTFYHYFESKDEILLEIPRRQISIIRTWANRPQSHPPSLENHINGLLLSLAESLRYSPKLMRSWIALSMHNDALKAALEEQNRILYEHLLQWLQDPNKARMLISAYLGTLLLWCLQDEDDLNELMHRQLAPVWTGIRASQDTDSIPLKPDQRGDHVMKVAVIGGGLAGLTAAAYLSEHPGVEGVLFERSPQLGGRAFTYEKAGFTLNYGAHAIYGIDRHSLSVMEKELGLSFSSKQVDKRRVMYAKNGQLTPAPLDFVNLMRTELLNPMQKVRFVGEITAIIANIHHVRNYDTLGDYLAQSDADEDVKELWEHLVCSNFFITPEEARKVSGAVISEYYHNLFLSGKPVNYVLGSWAVITNQLKQKIELSRRWEISLQEGVDGIRYADRKFWLQTKNRELPFDRIVFAMPVQQVCKLLKTTPWEPFLSPYEDNTATEVMVYDVGLKQVVAKPFSYISDMDNKLFISDVSATDHTLVPDGGQLLQGIAYLSDKFADEAERKAYLDNKTKQMEALFDKYYPGWREATEVKRVSKKAMVASVKNISGNHLLPNRIENVPFYFCGDGCQGKGELAERAFSSAMLAAKSILEEPELATNIGS
ncbi:MULTISPECIES: FAD-dependent oxidoreductase [unclassified Paenibacillus]|uniref:FAD-dependent oxidoreductase n=1 Tax=unclassified Paenibacillus TaxID=185978 RepID=UPI001AE60EE4|nr:MULTISPECIES: FAD-dependent oxidoreductase [unclassified Paenibacillus]MBP1156338.1 protoporphyrinogen oxidase/AcrR family transcriptional regulator [Paenibacillus sp. PvP091]MBP1168276.1 protoporphyrinogen oxidase/AcrR family transcriptional regulator [Paenibacillus sp. PvR098]MBP2439304.1 protoporphyrinogen oxidase/AcrR family transcriptional regulator [Paenibacillus sp. PvP052]